MQSCKIARFPFYAFSISLEKLYNKNFSFTIFIVLYVTSLLVLQT